jgi:hypothetical protein
MNADSGRAFARRAWVPLAALLIGVAIVAARCAALAPYAYPYFGDSASYIEMADSLRTTGKPRVSPWDLLFPETDAIPQPLFPPGLPVIVAALTPLAGDARTASAWPNRVAAALVPLLIVLLFRRYAPDLALLGLGVAVLFTRGVMDWHYIAYSDVACLALAIVALGAFVRAEGQDRRWLAAAGFAAGVAYTVRNAALAVLLASAFTLGWELLRSGFRSWRNALAWGAGAAVPLGALAAYNLATFGALQPYAMPPSTRPWTRNLVDWVSMQLHDLYVPFALVKPMTPAVAAVVLAVALALGARWWWTTRHDGRRHRLITLLGAYVAAGGAILIASRSRYEWADTIQVRHTLQYTWALGVLLLVAAAAVPTRVQRTLAVVVGVAVAVSAAHAVEHVRQVRADGKEAWTTVADDPRVEAAIRAIPEGTLIASNASVLFRIVAARPVRLVEFGGGDTEFEAALARVRAAAAVTSRPSAYVLWCHEHTAGASACADVPRDAGPRCRRLRGPPQIVALCDTDATR